MKRTIFTTVLLIGVITCATAQKSFNESSKIISLGVGIGSPYWSSYYTSALPVNPTLTIEKALTDDISVGTSISYSRSKFGESYYYNSYYNLRLNALYLAGRGAYHFDLSNEKIDLYAGGSLGYAFVWISDKTEGALVAGSGVAYSVFGGGRYYFAKNLGVYAELGYGSFSVANVGISIRSH